MFYKVVFWGYSYADMPTSTMAQTFTVAEDTLFLSVNKSPAAAFPNLQDHITKLKKLLKQWKINVNASKYIHLTFTLRKGNCPSVAINCSIIPGHNRLRYVGIYFDRRLTWVHHTAPKITQLKLETADIHWLNDRQSNLDSELKVLLDKALLKPIWMSNIEKLQRRQSKILRMITSASWFMTNCNIYRDLEIPTIRDEIKKSSVTSLLKFLIIPILLREIYFYLRDISDLKGF